MAIKTRVAKNIGAELEPGEEVVATCMCQMKGMMAATALGGMAGVLIAKRAGKGTREDAAAAGFPLAQSMMLVVTDRHLFVKSGKTTLGCLTAHDLAGAEVVKKNALSPWTIRIDMANGHQVTLEAASLMGPAGLVASIDRLARSA